MIVRAGTQNSVYLCDTNSVFGIGTTNRLRRRERGDQHFSLRPTKPSAGGGRVHRSQSDVLAVYKWRWGRTPPNEQDYIKALNTELLAGTGPDVLVRTVAHRLYLQKVYWRS
jgi:hypothetical protein